MQGYIDVKTASYLTGEDRFRIWAKVDSGIYRAEKRKSNLGGGSGGESYLIEVATLPVEAQILYAVHNGVIGGAVSANTKLVGYQQKFGEAGMEELLARLRVVQSGLVIRRLNAKNVCQQLEALAKESGVDKRTLYRWMDGYDTRGIDGIMKAVARKDKGSANSICPAAFRYAYRLYAANRRRTQANVYRMLCEKAAERGAQACEQCYFNEFSPAREEVITEGMEADYPLCGDPEKSGMRIPSCRQTLSRILATISDEELVYARKGETAWKNQHMVKATREKPKETNRLWAGDHHQLDCFVLDERGLAIRPWLTLWYDTANGCPVGWLLCKQPNTDTIMEAFCRAVAFTVHSPFHGTPAAILIDNGKDYRSKAFESGYFTEHDLGTLNRNIAKCSLLQLLNISVHHATAYHAWAKGDIERFFGTLESIWIRETPGWCGNSPEERPETFAKDLKRMIDQGTLWTMDELFVYLRDTAFPEYQNRPHSGHGGKAPLELYSTLPRARSEQPDWNMLTIARQHSEERKIHPDGVHFKNNIYWHENMMGLAGQYVTIRFEKSNLSTISLILQNGHFLCEAAVKYRLDMVDADQEQLTLHVENQHRQKRTVKEKIRRATRSVFADEVDPNRKGGNLTSIEYTKAAKAREETRKRLEEEKQARREPSSNPVKKHLQAMGAEFWRNG